MEPDLLPSFMEILIQLPLFAWSGGGCLCMVLLQDYSYLREKKKKKEWVNIIISLVGIF